MKLGVGEQSGTVRRICLAAVGVMLGVVLSRSGFTDWAELQKMFTFADFRMVLIFGLAVVLTGSALAIIPLGRHLPHRPIHKGTVVGGILFGVGWAVAGACPGAVLAQLGEGKAWALISAAGLVTGMVLYRPIHARFLRFDRGTCG